MAIAIQAFVFGTMARTMPQFAQLYQEMMPSEPLPGLTVMFLRIRPVWYIVVMAIMILALLAKEVLIPRRRIRAWSSVGFTVAAGLIFLLYVVAVFRPLIEDHGGLGR